MSWTIIKRKCYICKQEIILDQDNAIYDGKKYCHFDCYIESKLSMKHNKLTKEELIEQAFKIQKEGNKSVKEIVFKEKLCKWLQYSYRIIVLPEYFFTKIDSVYKGYYKGLSRGIPPEDLLDMWQRKKSELDSFANKKENKGNKLEGVNRLLYDLAIIISKYDSYSNWKEKQKILEQGQLKSFEQSQKQKINLNKINKVIENQIINNDTNINDLLEEVF